MKFLNSCALATLCLFSFAPIHSIELLFEPNKPVTQTIESVSTFNQKHAGIEILLTTTQKQVFDVEIISENTETELKSPPFTLKYTLRSMKFEVNANGTAQTFDTNVVSDSPEISVISYLIGKPLTFQVNKDFTVDQFPKEWSDLSTALPLLKTIFPKEYFSELFSTTFAFAGRDLKTGENSTLQRIIGDQLDINIPIRYELQKITYKEAEAEISGKFSEKGKKIKEPLDSGLTFDATAAMEGTIGGDAKWNRRNALETESSLILDFKGELKTYNEKIPFTLQFSEKISSKAKDQG